MLKKLYIDNFKALNDFEIEFNKFTILIGANASGKSTILNAVIFLKYCCSSSVMQFLESRKIKISDLCSKFSSKRTMTFKAYFDFEGQEVIWSIMFRINKTAETIRLHSEYVTVNNNQLLCYSVPLKNSVKSNKNYRYNERSKEKEEIMKGYYKQSIISLVDEIEAENSYPTLLLIKKLFESTEAFDLLSPKDMRRSARGSSGSIGEYGEKLPSFINELNDTEKKDLVDNIHKIFPNIIDVRSVVRGRPGWAYLEIEEEFIDGTINVSANNVSDGVLRLIAFIAIKHIKNDGGITVLDEIENGMNSEVLESLLRAFQENSEKNNQQFIATTHNTVLLDFIDHKNIRYIARGNHGNTKAYNPFDYPEIHEKLEYMYPGEIILNTSNDELRDFAYKSEDEES